MKRLDIWLGKRLFHPPIIAACHAMRQSQYRLHYDLWALFWLAGLLNMHLRQDWDWVDYMFAPLIWLFAIGSMLIAFSKTEHPKKPDGFWRAILWAGLLISLPGVAFGTPSSLRFTMISLLGLFAQYCLTITKLPPRRTKAEKRRMESTKSLRT